MGEACGSPVVSEVVRWSCVSVDNNCFFKPFHIRADVPTLKDERMHCRKVAKSGSKKYWGGGGGGEPESLALMGLKSRARMQKLFTSSRSNVKSKNFKEIYLKAPSFRWG